MKLNNALPPVGTCRCGCGQQTEKWDCNVRNKQKGEFRAYVRGHGYLGRGIKSGAWKGGRTMHKGYVLVYRPDHPAASKHGYVAEHLLVAEKAVGHYLPSPVLVHHSNEDRADNRNSNLVVCPNRSYHRMIHTRMRKLKICGHVDWLICKICKQYDSPINLRATGKNFRHPACSKRGV